MKLFIKLAPLLVSLVASTSIARTGGMDSGGADYIKKSAGLMYYQEFGKNITACLYREDPFPLSSETATNLIYSTFYQWKGYLKVRAKGSTYEVQVSVEPNRFEYPELYSNNLNVRQSEKGECDGSEDHKIYLGLKTEDIIKELKSKRFNNPVAFTSATWRREDFLWSKGLTWFAHQGSVDIGDADIQYPRWDSDTFYGTMLREWGRVFGIKGTIEGTIMREEFAYYLHPSRTWFPNGGRRQFFRSIDHNNQVLGNFELSPKSPSQSVIFSEENEVSRNYGRKIMGRPVYGRSAESRLNLVRKPYPADKPGYSHNEYMEGDIAFHDDRSEVKNRLRLFGELKPRNDHNRVFYRVTGIYKFPIDSGNGPKKNITFGSSPYAYRRVLTGTIEGKDGRTYPIVAVYNFKTDPGVMHSRYADEKYRKRWAIFLLDDIKRVRLF